MHHEQATRLTHSSVLRHTIGQAQSAIDLLTPNKAVALTVASPGNSDEGGDDFRCAANL
jgi:hypothetical protein